MFVYQLSYRNMESPVEHPITMEAEKSQYRISRQGLPNQNVFWVNGNLHQGPTLQAIAVES